MVQCYASRMPLVLNCFQIHGRFQLIFGLRFLDENKYLKAREENGPQG